MAFHITMNNRDGTVLNLKTRRICDMAKKNGNIFTLIELMVVIAIIAVLCSLLFPALSKARKKVETAVCASNCKQISVALAQYSSDFNDWIVPIKTPNVAYWNGTASDRPWFELLGKFGQYSPLDYGVKICSLGNNYYDPDHIYHSGGGRITCPSQKENNQYSYSDYAANQRLFGLIGTYATRKVTQITQPSAAHTIFDNGRKSDHGVGYITAPASGDIYVSLRHDLKTNVLFADSHVDGKSFQDLTSLGNHGGSTELLEGF